MFTPEQEAFLADFADKGIAETKDAEKRNTEDQAAYEAKLARDTFIADLRDEKEKEILEAINNYDAAQITPSPVVLVDPDV